MRGRGLMYAVELVESKETSEPLNIPTVERIIHECKKRGLMIRNLENIITFVPILSMSKKEVKKMTDIFTEVLLEELGQYEF